MSLDSLLEPGLIIYELNPLFHSEISSTHLFYDIFNRHKGITASLIEDCFGEHPEQIVIAYRSNGENS